MRWILILGLFSLTLFADSLAPRGQGLSGDYQVAYLESNLAVITRSQNNHKKEKESFNYEKIAKAPIPEPFYMLHDPKGPTATLIGAGSDSPRLCEGEASLLSQELECTPLSQESWVDKNTQCGIKKIFIETILYDVIHDLRYARAEIISLDKSTEEACALYKNNLLDQLEKDEAPDFFKAMKRAGLLKNPEELPDVYILTHFYQASPSETKAVETSEGDKSGAYSLKYAGKSKSLSWFGDEKKDLQQSSVFNASDIEMSVAAIDNILLFHEPEKNAVRIAGGGRNRVRKCELESQDKEKSEEVFVCTLFKANEEELGTGCSIQHWIQERVTLSSKHLPRYERVEQRHLQEASSEGCQQYRSKIAEELKEGSAELFFRVLKKTGGIGNESALGDTFQLVHEYTVQLDN